MNCIGGHERACLNYITKYYVGKRPETHPPPPLLETQCKRMWPSAPTPSPPIFLALYQLCQKRQTASTGHICAPDALAFCGANIPPSNDRCDWETVGSQRLAAHGSFTAWISCVSTRERVSRIDKLSRGSYAAVGIVGKVVGGGKGKEKAVGRVGASELFGISMVL